MIDKSPEQMLNDIAELIMPELSTRFCDGDPLADKIESLLKGMIDFEEYHGIIKIRAQESYSWVYWMNRDGYWRSRESRRGESLDIKITEEEYDKHKKEDKHV